MGWSGQQGSSQLFRSFLPAHSLRNIHALGERRATQLEGWHHPPVRPLQVVLVLASARASANGLALEDGKGSDNSSLGFPNCIRLVAIEERAKSSRPGKPLGHFSA